MGVLDPSSFPSLQLSLSIFSTFSFPPFPLASFPLFFFLLSAFLVARVAAVGGQAATNGRPDEVAGPGKRLLGPPAPIFRIFWATGEVSNFIIFRHGPETIKMENNSTQDR